MSESKKSSNFFKDMLHVASHSDPSGMRIGLIHGVHGRALAPRVSMCRAAAVGGACAPAWISTGWTPAEGSVSFGL
jgi:hypothetical protein